MKYEKFSKMCLILIGIKTTTLVIGILNIFFLCQGDHLEWSGKNKEILD